MDIIYLKQIIFIPIFLYFDSNAKFIIKAVLLLTLLHVCHYFIIVIDIIREFLFLFFIIQIHLSNLSIFLNDPLVLVILFIALIHLLINSVDYDLRCLFLIKII